MGITRYVLKHPVTTIMGLLCLIVFGISSMMTNGVDNFVLTAGGYATWAAFGMANRLQV